MSFYTALTGLNAATAQLSVTSNNIANVGTTGFKRSRADFGDIFATSPLQKASSTIGQGVALKQVSQEFSQGNIQFSANSLDIAITGDGFFPLKSADGLQDIYTRNGTFMLNDSYNVVNSAGQALIAAAVDSSGKADLDNLSKLLIPRKTTGDAVATSEVQLGLNLPADAEIPTQPFDRNDPTTYNKTTALTVYDAGGNGYLATVYYRKTQVATPEDPSNKWQTYVYIGDTKLQELLIQSTDKNGEKQYVNKYGEIRAESQIPPQDIARGVTKLFNLDDLKNPVLSTPATVNAGTLTTTLISEWKNGIDFPTKVSSLIGSNPDDGMVFSPVAGGSNYSLTMRDRVDGIKTTDADTGAITQWSFNSDDTTAGFQIKLGSDVFPADGSSATLTDLATLIDADPKYAASVTGTTLNVTVDSTTTAITELPAATKLTLLNPTPISAASLQDLATAINADAGLIYEATINSDGAMVVVPRDGETEVPEITMTADVADGFFVRPASQSATTVSFQPALGSGSFTLTLGTDTYTGADLSAVKTAVDTAGKYAATISTASDGSQTLSLSLVTASAIPTDALLSADTAGVPGKRDSIVFDLEVDGASPLSVDLSYLSDLASTKRFTGVEIAREITNAINKTYGDQRYFNFSDFASSTDPDNANLFRLVVGEDKVDVPISLHLGRYGIADLSKVTQDDAISAIQAELDKQAPNLSAPITVGYDPVRQSFTFKSDDGSEVAIRSYGLSRNELFGLTSTPTTVSQDNGTWGASVLPNGGYIVNPEEQRTGIEVKFDEVNNRFTISSGTTGDTSSLKITNASAMANALFGLQTGAEGVQTTTSATPQRGITSTPAVLTGNAIGINLDNKFRVDASNNQFVVTVDNVTGLITMPERSDYTAEEFRQELENRINALADNFGRTVNGVKIEIATQPGTNNKFFKFTTGTTGDNSFLKVSSNSIWGLADLESARGSTSRWLEPPQATSVDGFPLYVDRDGLETSDPGTFSEDETRDLWSPIFLDKGELTFDTGGNLKSPMEAIAFKSTTIGASGATLQFSIDYVSSTQYSSPFSVNKQDQNGRPEGDLIGVDIGDDGLVSASYSNGTQKSLAKIVLVNFAAPTGLRQIGDASYYATSKSGAAKYGEAGSAGFGTVRAGARERANVDLTAELIELITAQRNFQANAKAIETNNTLTQAIINIRS